ncbi:MAG: hypothetical protein ABS69_07865 [Nitrosomonadales bacterium SCN 54-20]|nr:MAG: hypothetical protein ABS69_07865 [Nitrosomonadales bacterium SCN 54-20]
MYSVRSRIKPCFHLLFARLSQEVESIEQFARGKKWEMYRGCRGIQTVLSKRCSQFLPWATILEWGTGGDTEKR